MDDTLRLNQNHLSPRHFPGAKDKLNILLSSTLVHNAECLNVADSSTLAELIDKFTNAERVEDQIISIKEISLNLQKCIKNNDTNQILTTYLSVIIDIYLKSPLKHPVKCSITKVLNSLEPSTMPLASNILGEGLLVIMEKACESQDYLDFKSAVSAQLGLFENSTLGQSITENHFDAVLAFLERLLQMCFQSLKKQKSPVLKLEIYKLAHSVTRVIILALQSMNLHELTDQKFDRLLSSLLKTSGNLLNCSDIPLDTRCNCGFVVVLILNRVRDEICWMELLTMNKERKTSLGLELSDYISYVCVASGMLSGLSWQQLSHCHSDSENTIASCILDLMLQINNCCQESNVILGVWRTVQQLTRTIISHPVMIEQMQGASFVCLVELVWDLLDHYMDTIRHLTRSILGNLLALRVHLSRIGVDVVKRMTEAVLQSPDTKRAKYVILSAMASSLGSKELLFRLPDIVSILFSSLQNSTTSSHASSAIVALFTSHFKEVSQEAWIEVWIPPLLSALQNDTEINAKEEVFSKAIKLCPAALSSYIIRPHLLHTQTTSPKTMITCLRIMRKHGIFYSPKVQNDATKSFWLGVVPITLIQDCLFLQDDEIRLTTLSMIVESNKSTEPVGLLEIDAVTSYLKYNMNCDVPSVRQRSLALISKFLHRIKESAHSLSRELELQQNETGKRNAAYELQPCKEFILTLINFCYQGIAPGANFSRRCCAMNILTYIKDIIGTDSLLSPQDYENAFWTYKNALSLLNVILIDSFEDNKIMARNLLLSFPPRVLNWHEETSISKLFENGCKMASSINPSECLSAAYLLQLCVSLPGFRELFSSQDNSEYLVCVNPNERALYFAIQKLKYILDSQLKVAERNIMQAALNAPMHGILFCIRQLFLSIPDLRSIEDKNNWRVLFNDLVQLCIKLNTAVSPVVNSSSPEGHLPMDFNPVGNEDGTPIKTTAQMVLLTCWRTVKEVSLLFGELSRRCPLLPSECGLLNEDHLLLFGKQLTMLLEETKHRGAFEQAYVGFSMLAERLWRHPDERVHKLPRLWLDDLIETIQLNQSSSSKLCATRRSAGVPFMVQALVAAELETSGSTHCLNYCMSLLLDLTTDRSKPVESRTHALNILRALFRHAPLAEAVTPFIAKGFIVALSGFQGKTWAERNSATLLFSSLMTRVFGVRRNRGELGPRNKMTGRTFFHRYPELYGFLLNELKKGVAALDLHNVSEHAMIYPVLLVLARLYPSPLDGTDLTLQLTSFVPFVKRCAGSSVLKTRMVAAQAIVPLISLNSCELYIANLMAELGNTENFTHGALLQMLHLHINLSHWKEKCDTVKKCVEVWSTNLKNHAEFFTENHSFLVMQTYLQICELVAEHWFSIVPIPVWNSLKEDISKSLNSQQNCIGYSLYVAQASRLLLRLCLTQKENLVQLIVDLLNYNSYEVVQEVLIFIEKIFIYGGNGLEIDEEDEKILFDISDDSVHWTQRLPAADVSWAVNQLRSSGGLLKLLVGIVCEDLGLRSRLALRAVANFDASLWDSRLDLSHLITLSKSQHEGQSCAALSCIGSRLKYLVSQKDTEPECQELSQLLLRFCSEERSVASRDTAVNFLLEHKPALLREYQFLSDRAVCELWTCVVKLIMDDDQNVREKAAEIANTVERVVPKKALELAIDGFTKAMASSKSYYEATLILWGLGCLPDVQDVSEEDRVFDKSEMNLFSEQFLLTSLVCEHFSKLLVPLSPLSSNELCWIMSIISDSKSDGHLESVEHLLKVVKNLLRIQCRLCESKFVSSTSIAEAFRRLHELEMAIFNESSVKFNECFTFNVNEFVAHSNRNE